MIVEEMESLRGSLGIGSEDRVGYEAEIARRRQSLEAAKAQGRRLEPGKGSSARRVPSLASGKIRDEK